MKSTMKNRKKTTHSGRNEFRIIAGDWRGRKFSFPTVQGLRPSHDRIRETLFNWLAVEVVGCRCLDLFAGSGALGLEALSRGAQATDFVELNAAASRSLQQHLSVLKCEHGSVVQGDALSVLNQLPEQNYDLVFLDPPFHQGWLDKILNHPRFLSLLTVDAQVYIERETDVPLPEGWLPVKEKSTSTLVYGLYRNSGDSQPSF